MQERFFSGFYLYKPNIFIHLLEYFRIVIRDIYVDLIFISYITSLSRF